MPPFARVWVQASQSSPVGGKLKTGGVLQVFLFLSSPHPLLKKKKKEKKNAESGKVVQACNPSNNPSGNKPINQQTNILSVGLSLAHLY